MKIISTRPVRGRRRRPARPAVITEEPTSMSPVRKPAKKALLIGINYASQADTEIKELKGPHKDVADMRQLLIEEYGYHPDDITVMTDSHDSNPGKVPTRRNMLYEISQLVEDARPGDHFFFHYSGHVTQIENRNNSEEDGMDECLIPIDGNSLKIQDNVLRSHLVDPLPIGSHLVAVFDSCHSASLLDLPHYRCNRVYVPWVNKGRRKSDSLWNANVRKHGIYVQNRNIYQSTRTNQNVVQSRRTSIEVASPRSPLSRRPSADGSDITDATSETLNSTAVPPLPRRQITIRTNVRKLKSIMTPTSASPHSRGGSPLRQANKENSFWLPELERCDSPTSIYPCDGRCRERTPCLAHQEQEHADVISLSSCKDSQMSWEDAQGVSMSQILVKILKRDPHPTFRDLMMNVGHDLHKITHEIHREARKFKHNMKLFRKHQDQQAQNSQNTHAQQRSLSSDNALPPTPKMTHQRLRKWRKSIKSASVPLNMDNFQDPQLSSLGPLDLGRRFEL